MKVISLFLILFPFYASASVQMALTIDDLPVASSVPGVADPFVIAKKILVALKAENVPEVYGFVNGIRLLANPSLKEVLKLWVASGYPLGNHGFTHRGTSQMSIDEFKKEIGLNEAVLKEYGGAYNWKYFRYPFMEVGATPEKRDALGAYLKEKAYTVAQASVDLDDWSWNRAYLRCIEQKNVKKTNWLKAFPQEQRGKAENGRGNGPEGL